MGTGGTLTGCGQVQSVFVKFVSLQQFYPRRSIRCSIQQLVDVQTNKRIEFVVLEATETGAQDSRGGANRVSSS